MSEARMIFDDETEDCIYTETNMEQAERRAYLRGLEDAAKVADKAADEETRKALGANAGINASQIAAAIRALAAK